MTAEGTTDDPTDHPSDDPVSDGPAGDDSPRERPTWEDPYLDGVAARLQFNYDLARDERVRGVRFPLYGRLEMDSHKQFLHPAISYGHQYSYEHLYVDRRPRVGVEDLEAFVSLAHDLAEDIEVDEEHYATDFTFAVVVEDLPDEVASFVANHDDRTMLKYGYNGHYEVNLVAVVPDEQRVVDSDVAVAEAFHHWDDEQETTGVLDQLRGLF
ncbi:hypothetical protein ACFPYI_10260 [Halomarina salina]|uniref:DUF8052 domain-containing protein n=1 Tax=Halomarina salina TaxID=1872699 RepID=A0ABD5RN36_9EURY|nr:hypothetical protein [Halomarina salina]